MQLLTEFCEIQYTANYNPRTPLTFMFCEIDENDVALPWQPTSSYLNVPIEYIPQCYI